MARSAVGISAIFARTSASPSARSWAGSRRAATFRSRALSCIAARSSSVQTLLSLSAVFFVVVIFVAGISAFLLAVRRSAVLDQPEDVAIWVGEGSHETAA